MVVERDAQGVSWNRMLGSHGPQTRMNRDRETSPTGAAWR